MKIERLFTGLLVLVVLTIVGCATKGTVSEESLGLRKTNLYAEEGITVAKVEYSKEAPGAAKTIDRSFENAPPLIPHSVEGLLPITKSNNSCLGCHLPDVAKSVGATAIPPSHFVSFRPATLIKANGTMIKDGEVVVNTANISAPMDKLGKLNNARYNCSQCHVPQANVKPLVKNNFKPDFKSKKDMHRSNLLKVINDGVY